MELSTLTLSFEARHSLRAFNTDVSIVASDWRELPSFTRLESFFAAYEARFSRFLPSSDVGQFNHRRAECAVVSAELFALINRCHHFSRITEGIFNPLILTSLEAAGYDRSFEHLSKTSRSRHGTRIPPFEVLQIAEVTREVSLDLPWGIDLGGIGKGHAVDMARALLPDGCGVLIDAGGDIFATGRGPGGAPWLVDVADPHAPGRVIARVELVDQAVASSWITRRRWRTDAGWSHHLIDPRTGLPADSGLAGATVIAARTDEADVFAKTAVILGAEAGLEFLERMGVDGLLIGADGTQLHTPGWPGQSNGGIP
ncbi:MAG: FAD:protein FMN transferase [Dehalococcoidia bacterium]